MKHKCKHLRPGQSCVIITDPQFFRNTEEHCMCRRCFFWYWFVQSLPAHWRHHRKTKSRRAVAFLLIKHFLWIPSEGK